MDSAVLSLICAGLSASQEDEVGAVIRYAKSHHCLDNLKDLRRFLWRDDPQQWEVFKQVCKWKIASRDKVPIIENYQNDCIMVITAGEKASKCWSNKLHHCVHLQGAADRHHPAVLAASPTHRVLQTLQIQSLAIKALILYLF